MARDTLVSWKTVALFARFPPLALLAIVCFPPTIGGILWLYYRGRGQALLAAGSER